jgi:hypothetical protein
MYRFVQAANDYGVAKGPRLGITWHMAEGGGTVAFLAKANPRGVSVHFVVQGTGEVVQMLLLDHANGSINPQELRTTDDPTYARGDLRITYGATAAREVLGVWARDPNSATIGVEIEGFAVNGPNTVQAAAMASLWGYLAGQYPGIRSLAHRDFADYKACPGHLIPWELLGGHGKEPTLKSITTTVEKLIDWPDQTPYFDLDGATKIGTANATVGRRSPFGCGTHRAIYLEGTPRRLALITPSLVYDAPLAEPPDTTVTFNAGVDAAVAAAGTARK